MYLLEWVIYMKKKVLSIFLLLCLVGCSTNNITSPLDGESSNISSEETNQKESSFSSEEITS